LPDPSALKSPVALRFCASPICGRPRAAYFNRMGRRRVSPRFRAAERGPLLVRVLFPTFKPQLTQHQPRILSPSPSASNGAGMSRSSTTRCLHIAAFTRAADARCAGQAGLRRPGVLIHRSGARRAYQIFRISTGAGLPNSMPTVAKSDKAHSALSPANRRSDRGSRKRGQAPLHLAALRQEILHHHPHRQRWKELSSTLSYGEQRLSLAPGGLFPGAQAICHANRSDKQTGIQSRANDGLQAVSSGRYGKG